MVVKSRNWRIGLISIGAIFVIYLFYNLISRTPPIEIDTGEEFADTVAESNTSEFDDKIGKVGSVGVGTIQKAKYSHLNAQKQIDREFGFEKLLHAEGDEWEIEKPYMNIYRHNLKCYMTADKGRVRVEYAAGRAAPTDATLTGNVVARILPENNSSVQESFIYLDDVIFDSEKSQFLSAGPVKFISQDAQMFGKGLEIVYNDGLDRLESLKIIYLESLHIRQSSKTSLLSSEQTRPAAPAGQPSTDQQETRGEEQKTKEGNYYKCIFRKNVVIDSPEQLILADEVSVSDILWSESADRGGEKRETTDEGKERMDEAGGKGEPNESSEKFVDIIVTCDDGILVVPMDFPAQSVAADDKGHKSFNDEKGRPTFIARSIDYSLLTEAVVANRPSELTFYVNDMTGAEGGPASVPVKVTAQEKAEFRPALNQVIFEGDVLCTMLRDDINFQQKYDLSAPKLTIDLTENKQSRADIKHLTATGEVVQLDTSKWAGEELLGFTKLKCLQFDYDAAERMFLAAGSGVIAVDNSKAEPAKKAGKFSLQRPSYAVVRNFDTLKYFSEKNLVIADAANEQVLIDYFPIVKGQYGPQTSATANHIEAVLYETPDGRTELSTLNAKGGITYEEQKLKKGKTVHFMGSEMFYDGGKSMITAWGDESQPCFLNGALAPGIEYDLKTDRIKTKIVGPGMLQVGE